MVAGHFATALVAKQQASRGHLAFYLIISQLPDLLWHMFHFSGHEVTTPANPMVASLDTMHAQMTYSHDLLPTLVWTLVATLAGRGLYGAWRPGLAAGALVIVHGLCDALSGHPHYVFGPDTALIGLGLYQSAPYVALLIEAVFTAGVIGLVLWTDAREGLRRSRRTLTTWALVLGGGVLSLVPIADHSLSELTGLGAPGALAGTLVPGLVLTYATMLLALIWADEPPHPVQRRAP